MRPPSLATWALCVGALSYLRAGGFVLHMETDCQLSSDGRVLKADWALVFNKVPFVCYDSNSDQFLPCRDGLGQMGPWRREADFISTLLQSQASAEWGQQMRERCQGQIQPRLWVQTGERLTPPNVHIYPVSPENTLAPVMLACDVRDFYPRKVSVVWLRNGVPVKTEPEAPAVSNGDWTYQAQVTLPVDPQRGDTYTCSVKHTSLPEPVTKDWEPGLPLERCVKMGVSAAVLGVGLVFLVAGLVCRQKQAAKVAGYLPIEGDNYPAGST